MLKKYPQFFIGYTTIAMLEIIARIRGVELLEYFTKPLITIVLMGFIVSNLRYRGRFSIKIIIGLLFSLAGDVFLLFDSNQNLFFTLGLLSFLLAHVFYINAFYIDVRSRKLENPINVFPALTIFFGFAFIFYIYLFPQLRELEIPVAIYCLIISAMTTMAYMRKKKCSTLSFELVLVGAVFFMLSDSLLAYHKFMRGSAWLSIVVMITYMIAQLLITLGTVERKHKRDSVKIPQEEV